jgi:hypothetical protein
MKILRAINRRINLNDEGVQVQSDVNVVLSANVGERRGGADEQESKKKRKNMTTAELERQKAVMRVVSPPTIAPEPDMPIDLIPDKAV